MAAHTFVVLCVCILSVEAGLLEKIVFTSKPENISAMIGDTVEFPCVTRNTDDAVITWRLNDSRLLSAGSIKITREKRLTVVGDGRAIRIKDVQKEDVGLYQCQVNLQSSTPSLEHVLHVLEANDGEQQEIDVKTVLDLLQIEHLDVKQVLQIQGKQREDIRKCISQSFELSDVEKPWSSWLYENCNETLIERQTVLCGSGHRSRSREVRSSLNDPWRNVTLLEACQKCNAPQAPDKGSDQLSNTSQAPGVNKTALFWRSDDFVVGRIDQSWHFAYRTFIYFSVLYHTAGNGSQCCQECKDIYDPTTFTFNFYEFTSDNQTNKYCSCSKEIVGDPKTFPTPERIRGFQGQYFTELCGNTSIGVAGGVGEDKHFVADSVDYLGWTPVFSYPLAHSREAEGRCCKACKNFTYNHYRYTKHANMVEYDRGGNTGRCKCIDVKPGKTPTTQKVQWFADTC